MATFAEHGAHAPRRRPMTRKYDISDILPPEFRGRSRRVALSLFVRAALNFLGVALLLPVLI